MRFAVEPGSTSISTTGNIAMIMFHKHWCCLKDLPEPSLKVETHGIVDSYKRFILWEQIGLATHLNKGSNFIKLHLTANSASEIKKTKQTEKPTKCFRMIHWRLSVLIVYKILTDYNSRMPRIGDHSSGLEEKWNFQWKKKCELNCALLNAYIVSIYNFLLQTAIQRRREWKF